MLTYLPSMSDDLSDIQKVVGAKWSAENRPKRSRFWESDRIKRHISKKICGSEHMSMQTAFHRLLAARKPFKRALSIGCGEGGKEISLLRAGVVERFTCYEVADYRAAKAREIALLNGLADRFEVRVEDAFKKEHEEFDLVYWNAALHHMMDTPFAVRWSCDRLRPGGMFAMFDFVGPTAFQWSDIHLHYVNAFRSRLPDEFFFNSKRRPVPRIVERVDKDRLWRKDPSEAADSGRILDAVRSVFSNVNIIPTGGAIYHTATNDILAYIPDESPFIGELLALDDFMIEMGVTMHAVALAIR
jgi:SAM-dependent methyltransferase